MDVRGRATSGTVTEDAYKEVGGRTALGASSRSPKGRVSDVAIVKNESVVTCKEIHFFLS